MAVAVCASHWVVVHAGDSTVHSRLVVEVGAVDWYCVDALQGGVSAAQTRLVVEVGAVDWYCVALHTVKLKQARS